MLIKKKRLLLAVSLIVIVLVSVGSTLAVLTDITGTIRNIFSPTKLTSQVEEVFEDNIKKNVQIRNTSKDVAAYIRAYVVFSWKDDDGNIYPQVPVAGTDYNITWGATNWDLSTSDGYYYYKKPVPAGAVTYSLIKSCSPVMANTPSGYHLEVEIISDAIQANPISVVKEQWGVTVVNKTEISK